MFKKIFILRRLSALQFICLMWVCLLVTSCDGDFLYVENKYPGVLACTLIVALVGGYLGYHLADNHRKFAGLLCAVFSGAAGFALSDFIIM